MEEKEKQVTLDMPEVKDIKQESEDLISKANAAAARQEAANKELERLLAIQERQKVEATMGGKTETSVEPPEESPVD